MPYRLIQISLTDSDMEDLGTALEGRPVERLWIEPADNGLAVARILVPIPETEGVTDALTDRFGEAEEFQVLILPVEAVIPDPELEARAAEKDGQGEGEEGSGQGSPGGEGEESGKPESPPMRISREELYADAWEGAKLTRVFLATVALSTVVAAVGLLRDDVAVIIGAMVIAPLLGPNMALALAWTLGDEDLARESIKTTSSGALLALALSVGMGAVLGVANALPYLIPRTQVGLDDLVLALASGSAGALAYTGGLAASVVGVMVAVALLPPLVTAGLLLGAGDLQLAGGALLLVLTNVVCLNLAAILTFLAQRIRPRTWWEAEKAKKATRRAVASWMALLVLLVVLILL